jgi:hypothetical protein
MLRAGGRAAGVVMANLAPVRLAWIVVVLALACAAARQAARRKGRTLACGFWAFWFPPLLLLLELLPTSDPPPAVASNLVLEWVASLVVLVATPSNSRHSSDSAMALV